MYRPDPTTTPLARDAGLALRFQVRDSPKSASLQLSMLERSTFEALTCSLGTIRNERSGGSRLNAGYATYLHPRNKSYAPTSDPHLTLLNSN